jgi:hypothetical protein
MADTKANSSGRAQMSPRERRLRSRIIQLLSQNAVLRGTLAVRERTCGKKNCKCARGEKHVSLYLVLSEQGKLRQLFIPREYEDAVRQAVAQYQEVRQLLESVSMIYFDKVKGRQLK